MLLPEYHTRVSMLEKAEDLKPHLDEEALCLIEERIKDALATSRTVNVIV